MQRYHVQRTIGEGAFSSVIEARCVDTGETVAIKRMKKRRWKDSTTANEIEALKNMNHVNVIRLKEAFRHDYRFYLVFEKMDQNLLQLIGNRKGRPFGEDTIRSISRQILAGVAYIHDCGYFHRDLKPENILLRGLQVKIADFGLVQKLDDTRPLTNYISTRWYRAPEILLECNRYSYSIDVWAVGTIIAEIVMTRPLFPGRNQLDQLHRIFKVVGSPSIHQGTRGLWYEGALQARQLGVCFIDIPATGLRPVISGVSDELLALLEQLLVLRPEGRLTSRQALHHPVFTRSRSLSSTTHLSHRRQRTLSPITLPQTESTLASTLQQKPQTPTSPFLPLSEATPLSPLLMPHIDPKVLVQPSESGVAATKGLVDSIPMSSGDVQGNAYPMETTDQSITDPCSLDPLPATPSEGETGSPYPFIVPYIRVSTPFSSAVPVPNVRRRSSVHNAMLGHHRHADHRSGNRKRLFLGRALRDRAETHPLRRLASELSLNMASRFGKRNPRHREFHAVVDTVVRRSGSFDQDTADSDWSMVGDVMTTSLKQPRSSISGSGMGSSGNSLDCVTPECANIPTDDRCRAPRSLSPSASDTDMATVPVATQETTSVVSEQCVSPFTDTRLNLPENLPLLGPVEPPLERTDENVLGLSGSPIFEPIPSQTPARLSLVLPCASSVATSLDTIERIKSPTSVLSGQSSTSSSPQRSVEDDIVTKANGPTPEGLTHEEVSKSTETVECRPGESTASAMPVGGSLYPSRVRSLSLFTPASGTSAGSDNELDTPCPLLELRNTPATLRPIQEVPGDSVESVTPRTPSPQALSTAASVSLSDTSHTRTMDCTASTCSSNDMGTTSTRRHYLRRNRSKTFSGMGWDRGAVPLDILPETCRTTSLLEDFHEELQRRSASDLSGETEDSWSSTVGVSTTPMTREASLVNLPSLPERTDRLDSFDLFVAEQVAKLGEGKERTVKIRNGMKPADFVNQFIPNSKLFGEGRVTASKWGGNHGAMPLEGIGHPELLAYRVGPPIDQAESSPSVEGRKPTDTVDKKSKGRPSTSKVLAPKVFRALKAALRPGEPSEPETPTNQRLSKGSHANSQVLTAKDDQGQRLDFITPIFAAGAGYRGSLDETQSILARRNDSNSSERAEEGVPTHTAYLRQRYIRRDTSPGLTRYTVSPDLKQSKRRQASTSSFQGSKSNRKAATSLPKTPVRPMVGNKSDAVRKPEAQPKTSSPLKARRSVMWFGKYFQRSKTSHGNQPLASAMDLEDSDGEGMVNRPFPGPIYEPGVEDHSDFSALRLPLTTSSPVSLLPSPDSPPLRDTLPNAHSVKRELHNPQPPPPDQRVGRSQNHRSSQPPLANQGNRHQHPATNSRPNNQQPRSQRTVTYVIGRRSTPDKAAHLLGINSLVIDPWATDNSEVTHLGARPEQTDRNTTSPINEPHNVTDVPLEPRGKLYTAGRDGLTIAWQLNLPTTPDGMLHRPSVKATPPVTTYSAASQHHADWVNDIALCANGEAVATASSDRTVKIWRPAAYRDDPNLPPTVSTVGCHGDYVKSLAYTPDRQWLASGGLDRKILLWDIASPRATPLTTFSRGSDMLSVYTLAASRNGNVLVSGSPEKLVRVWDPRSGKAITNLTGHTDNIRTVIVSNDGELILSGSSDTTIKLWSLSAGRCIATYTYHTDSIWSLYSDHPRLDYFYSGGKDGLIAKTLTTGVTFTSTHSTNASATTLPIPAAQDSPDTGLLHPDRTSNTLTTNVAPQGALRTSIYADGYSNPSLTLAPPAVIPPTTSESVAIAREPRGIVKLVALNNAYIWTATHTSDIKRWKDIRHDRPQICELWDENAAVEEDKPAVPDANPEDPASAEDDSSTEAVVSPIASDPAEADAPMSPSLSGAGSPSSLEVTASVPTKPKAITIPNSYLTLPSSLEGKQSSFAYSPPSPVPLGAMLLGGSNFNLAMRSQDVNSRVPDREPSNTSNSPLTKDVTTSPSSISSKRTHHSLRDQNSNPDLSTYRIDTTGKNGKATAEDGQDVGCGSPDDRQSDDEPSFLTTESTVVRVAPDEVIRGDHGLVRCVVLNNRFQALALDTAGQVTLWDLIRCHQVKVLGSIYDLVKTSAVSESGGNTTPSTGKPKAVHFESSPVLPPPTTLWENCVDQFNTLDVIPSWCVVDTKIGAISVHLDVNRCFDAEQYADVLLNPQYGPDHDASSDHSQFNRALHKINSPTILSGVRDKPEIPQDQRMNLGRWVLRYLLEGYADTRLLLGGVQEALRRPSQSIAQSGVDRPVGMRGKPTRTALDMSPPGAPRCDNIKSGLSQPTEKNNPAANQPVDFPVVDSCQSTSALPQPASTPSPVTPKGEEASENGKNSSSHLTVSPEPNLGDSTLSTPTETLLSVSNPKIKSSKSLRANRPKSSGLSKLLTPGYESATQDFAVGGKGSKSHRSPKVRSPMALANLFPRSHSRDDLISSETAGNSDMVATKPKQVSITLESGLDKGERDPVEPTADKTPETQTDIPQESPGTVVQKRLQHFMRTPGQTFTPVLNAADPGEMALAPIRQQPASTVEEPTSLPPSGAVSPVPAVSQSGNSSSSSFMGKIRQLSVRRLRTLSGSSAHSSQGESLGIPSPLPALPEIPLTPKPGSSASFGTDSSVDVTTPVANLKEAPSAGKTLPLPPPPPEKNLLKSPLPTESTLAGLTRFDGLSTAVPSSQDNKVDPSRQESMVYCQIPSLRNLADRSEFYPYNECPPILIPADTTVLIFEESAESSAAVPLYRGTVGHFMKSKKQVMDAAFQAMRKRHQPTAALSTQSPDSSAVTSPLEQRSTELTTAQDKSPPSPLGITIPRQVLSTLEYFESTAPPWLLEFLLCNRMPVKEPQRINFVMKIYSGASVRASDEGSGKEAITILTASSSANPNPNADNATTGSARFPGTIRLVANRMLRIRKVIAYAIDKLSLLPPPASHLWALQEEARRFKGDTQRLPHAKAAYNGLDPTLPRDVPPEIWLEVLCNDQVMSPMVTLGTVKQHIWKSSKDIILEYRYKTPSRSSPVSPTGPKANPVQ
ncbi:hypothetical protein IWQ62_001205 [Dispira parvispora]|uniref:Protein kinase domain-containing protein n=1 Tax=Dispira parvispora TaxID=1520584 RepID=A0A9W8E9C0_9FUNG|nr:hypothetical protein IWQ62_001205 [Dispira parvispora]